MLQLPIANYYCGNNNNNNNNIDLKFNIQKSFIDYK